MHLITIVSITVAALTLGAHAQEQNRLFTEDESTAALTPPIDLWLDSSNYKGLTIITHTFAHAWTLETSIGTARTANTYELKSPPADAAQIKRLSRFADALDDQNFLIHQHSYQEKKTPDEQESYLARWVPYEVWAAQTGDPQLTRYRMPPDEFARKRFTGDLREKLGKIPTSIAPARARAILYADMDGGYDFNNKSCRISVRTQGYGGSVLYVPSYGHRSDGPAMKKAHTPDLFQIGGHSGMQFVSLSHRDPKLSSSTARLHIEPELAELIVKKNNRGVYLFVEGPVAFVGNGYVITPDLVIPMIQPQQNLHPSPQAGTFKPLPGAQIEWLK